MQNQRININTLVDEAKFTPFHWGVLIWCLMIIIFDGYDLVIYGVALPLLMQEWALIGSASWLAGQHGVIWHDVWCHVFWYLV